jgi:phospholipase/carboxylesterase
MNAPGDLVHRARPPEGRPEGLLVLHHGRGTDESDLLPLANLFDPEERLHVVAPRAPLRLAGSPGNHWYVVQRVGFPDPDSFHSSYAKLIVFHDDLWRTTGIDPERTVLGGFSMGSVMSYATGLGSDRPAPAGILAFSGFVPQVEGWEPDLAARAGLPVLIAHGRRDPVIAVEHGRAARELLSSGGLSVEYLESDVGHSIDPAHVDRAREWIDEVVPGN